MTNEKYNRGYFITEELVKQGAGSHCKILQRVSPYSVVLECGPAYGVMTKYLKEDLHCEVQIIEYDRESFEQAIQFADGGVCVDIEEDSWLGQFKDGSFDYIIYADILEHLRDPQAVLEKMRRFLKPNGSVLLSVPNVAHGDIILNLLGDRFNYTPTGLLDNTHIHLFARENLWTMVQNAGYYIAEETCTRNPLFRTEQGKYLSQEFAEKVKQFFADYPNKDVYQYILHLVLNEAETKSEIGIINYGANSKPFSPIVPIQGGELKKKLYGKIIFDCGNGLSEENSIPFYIEGNGRIQQRIDLPEGCCAIRFDPVEGLGCMVWNLRARCESQFLKVVEHNGTTLNEIYIFRITDPQIYFEPLPSGSKWLEIEAEIIDFEQGAWTKFVQEVEESEQDRVTQAAARQQAETENDELRLQLVEVTERDHALEKELTDALERKDRLNRKLAHYQERYYAAIAQRDGLQQELVQVRQAYEVISNAFFWKVTKPGRVLMDHIKKIFRKSSGLRIIEKGLRCLKEKGFFYTWEKVKAKLGHRASKDTVAEIEKKKFPHLGELPKNWEERVSGTTVDIIVPVYNGYQYLGRLLQTIERTKVPYRLILIDDKSPDPHVLPFLKEYAKGKENVLILENETNLGFVESVNRGLEVSTHHVALVNTDVELPSGWLERLMGPIVLNKKVATTTPFTNCGTICSFPNFCEDNALFWEMGVDEIDEAFQTLAPEYPIIPTGVGFCMGMSRTAIDKIGFLDAENFGKGYGEENDWCRRAADVGFLNIHVDNLFVYHKHGGSFESEEKKALIKAHLERLSQKHPDYNRLVAEYCQLDPCAWRRAEVKKILLQKFDEVPVIVAFNHNWGGGASMYLTRERTRIQHEGTGFIQVEYMPTPKAFKVEYYYGENYTELALEKDISRLLSMLPYKISEIWINELVSYPDLYTILAEIAAFAKAKHAVLLFLLHDYFAVCPTINLLNTDGSYCNIPEPAVCQKCLENNKRFADIHKAERESGIMCWRKKWREFFDSCTEIRTFSEASKEIFLQTYPDVAKEKITLRPHRIDYLPQLSDRKKCTRTLNIAVIGHIAETKGAYIVTQVAKLIQKCGVNMRTTVIGDMIPLPIDNICPCTGTYTREELATKILENDIDIIWIPSIWPETFSYTAQEAMAMDLPIACFDIGAPAERVKMYEKGIIIPQIDAAMTIQELFKYGEAHILSDHIQHEKILFVIERTDYASRYRVEHFREELMFRGISSEVELLEKTAEEDLGKFSSIVFYRCSNTVGVTYLSRRAKQLGIKLFFDIDDLIFDVDFINSSGISQEEKEKYTVLAEHYAKIMRLCDGIITSTEALARCLRDSFPGKPICVRRNSVSLEMETLSVCAGEREREKTGKTIYLAYFSGSWTHDKDFALIGGVLGRIFEKYANVKLRIYGCVHLPEQLKKYQSRIELFEFTSDWRTLPEKVAQAHIHLAPLEDTVFNECKSENKWLEAALAGRPIVASYNPELARVIEDGITGFLCRSQEDWENALMSLIEDPELGKVIGKKAQEVALQTHLTRNSGDEAVKFVVDD